jgi:hypothetical protein
MSFSFKVNLSDAKVRTGGAAEIEPGVYKGKTISCEPYNGGKSIKFEVDCGEAGVAEIYVGTDFTKAGNKNGALTALASHGKNVEKIKQAGDSFVLTEQFFLNKECFVIVRKVEGVDDQGRPLLNDKSFLPPDRYEAMKNVKPTARAAATPNGTAGTQAAATGTPAAQPGSAAASALFD